MHELRAKGLLLKKPHQTTLGGLAAYRFTWRLPRGELQAVG